MAKFCGKCGAEISSDEKFCWECGAVLKEDSCANSTQESSKISIAKLEHQNENPIHKNKKSMLKKIVIAVLCLSTAGYLFWHDYQKAAQETAIETKAVESPQKTAVDDLNENKEENNASQNVSTKITPLALDDFILGDIGLGDTVQKVRQLKGDPKTVKQKERRIYYDYSDIGVVFEDGRVREIWTNDKTTLTRRQICADLNFVMAEKVYGTEFVKTRYEKLMLYEYTFTRKEGVQYILRLAVNSNQKIDYISVRIP